MSVRRMMLLGPFLAPFLLALYSLPAVLSVHVVLNLRILPVSVFRLMPLKALDLAGPSDPVVLDRKGRCMRHFPGADGTRSLPVSLDEIPDCLVQAFLAAEDKRFFDHCGYDPLAILRAIYVDVRAGRVVSGASTITQQLIRMSHPRPRTLKTKFIELLYAVQAEHLLDKRTILTHYLNRVPMGNNIRGVALASRFYFDRDVSRLDLARSALLAAIPQSPARMSGGVRAGKTLERRRRMILRRMLKLGFITAVQERKARSAKIAVGRHGFPFEAPHAVQMLVARPSPTVFGKPGTTIDLDIQRVAERVLRSRRAWLEERNCHQAAVVVLDVESSEILCLVGSMGVLDSPGGWNNGCLARRSAGSSLKPFAYALAIEKGWTAASMLKDTRRTYATPSSDYRPLNYSRIEHGPVLLRQALGASLNLTAVDLVKHIGVSALFDRLKSCGFTPVVDDPDHYGLGLVLGNLEVRLLDLAAAYAALARGGIYETPRLLLSGESESHRIFSRQVSFVVTDILSDPSVRVLAFGTPWYLDFPWPVAMKTGTSTSYRDAWLVAYTTRHVVAAWAGNFDGSPMKSLSGAMACGPIVHDILEYLYSRHGPPPFPEPPGIVRRDVCAVSGCVPGPSCPHVVREIFIEGHPPGSRCPVHKPSSPELVYLPSEYAPWTSKRLSQGLLGRFRLQGQRPVPLQTVVDVPAYARRSSMAHSSTETGAAAPLEGHVSIRPDEPIVSAWPEGAPRVVITSPLAVDRYVIDESRPVSEQLLRLQVELSRPVAFVDWFIDGMRFARVEAPYEVFWPMIRGRHRLVAACPDGTADAVTIMVE